MPEEEVSGSLVMVRILSTVSRHLLRERREVEEVRAGAVEGGGHLAQLYRWETSCCTWQRR